MRGTVVDFDEPNCELTEATLTKNMFKCKYQQSGDVYRVEASSRDGITYKGNWGWPDDFRNGDTLELTRFESKNKEIVLLGMWHRSDGYEGVYLFRLYP